MNKKKWIQNLSSLNISKVFFGSKPEVRKFASVRTLEVKNYIGRKAKNLRFEVFHFLISEREFMKIKIIFFKENYLINFSLSFPVWLVSL